MKRLFTIAIILSISCMSFSQTAGGGVIDIDGNNYQTVIIGTQEWMKENLRVTKYANGDAIPNVTDNTQWIALTTGAWSHYNNDSQYENPYGKLYNWYAAADTRNACPTGWHLPNDGEWTVLTDYLGGELVAGGKMKSTGTQYWQSPNTGASNESGFSGLPGGNRHYDGFAPATSHGIWWSSFQAAQNIVYFRSLSYGDGSASRGNIFITYGLSVRCLKDSAPLGVIKLNSDPKKLLKITDLTGREVEERPNTVLIYMYTDGSIERKFFID